MQASGQLCELARKGSLDLLQLYIACGAPVDAADYDKRTCLHLAASEGNMPYAEFGSNACGQKHVYLSRIPVRVGFACSRLSGF